jgi:CheY-like chemotaxis protein/HPt (histidine-containing phosphotransfer) domain-containing protein
MDIDMVPVRILVVDDDAVSREVIALHLEAAGYAVETAESGDAALRRLRAAGGLQLAVVLTDLQMPGTAGAELGRRLREVCGAGTLLLAMSGSEPEKAVLREFDGFLSKPFAIEAVAAAIAGSAPSAEGARGGDILALNEGVYRKLVGAMRCERLEQLYALCLSDAEARIVAMRRCASNGDDTAYRKEAHAIKGGCGMVGAAELQSLATSMEERGLGDANYVATLDEFMVACERLRRILVAHATEEKSPGAQGEDAR